MDTTKLGHAILATALASSACEFYSSRGGDGDQDPTRSRQVIPVSLNRDLDLLWVIDDSGSMRQEQEALAAGFPRFIEVLEGIEGGLPNIHLGIISSNVGTGPSGGGGEACANNGDNGELQVPAACPALTDGKRYIRDVLVDAETATREFNYTGDLTSQFSCMAQLGTSGCGFEQHLESMRRALNGNPSNAGFLRDDSYLAVIFLQDEDDCSTTTEGREMFRSQWAGDTRDSPLGEMSSFRCFEFGTTCEPPSERDVGPRDNCISGDDDTHFMANTASYADFLKGLKSDPSKVIVAGIMGDRENADGVVIVGEDTSKTPPELWVEPVCVVCPGGGSSGCSLGPNDPDGALVTAAPSVRMSAFLDQFPGTSTAQSICNHDPALGIDLSGSALRVAHAIRQAMGDPCLAGALADSDPALDGVQPDCWVRDVVNLGSDDEQRTNIPPCGTGDVPCFRLVEDRAICAPPAIYPTHLRLEVERGARAVPDQTSVVVSCRL